MEIRPFIYKIRKYLCWYSINHYLEYFYAEDEDTFYILDEQGKVVFEATNNGNEVWYLFDIDISTRNIWFAEYKGNNLTIKTTNGKTLEYEYSESVPELFVENGKIILRKHNKFGVIDFNGTTLIGFNYDTITVTSDGYAIVEVNDKYGVVDLEGTLLSLFFMIIYLIGIFLTGVRVNIFT